MIGTTKHTTIFDMDEAKIEVEFLYTPEQPASGQDGIGGQMIDPPVKESVEVLSIELINGDELLERFQNDYQEELIEAAKK